jgi:pantetheine-phosphate adenylyltransferase
VSASKNPLFLLDEREKMLRDVCSEFTNVEVTSFDGLLVTHVQRHDAVAILRGLRAVSDFELEFQLAQMNKSLSSDIETVFMMTRTQWCYLSSRIVKEIAELGGSVDEFVPANVAEALARKFHGKVE